MTPTLLGRIQTRLFLLATVGVVWTLVVTPALPGVEDVGAAYRVTFLALAIVAFVGIVWEFVYHGLQQFRWEKDWPTLYGLVTGFNEGVTTWLVLIAIVGSASVTALQYVIHFSTTWFLVWLMANGPMRVLSLRWRFNGGRLL